MGLKIFLAEEGPEPPVFEYDPKNGRLDVSGQSRSYQFQQTNGFESIIVCPQHCVFSLFFVNII